MGSRVSRSRLGKRRAPPERTPVPAGADAAVTRPRTLATPSRRPVSTPPAPPPPPTTPTAGTPPGGGRAGRRPTVSRPGRRYFLAATGWRSRRRSPARAGAPADSPPSISARTRSHARFSSRETCICEIPSWAAIRLCVIPWK